MTIEIAYTRGLRTMSGACLALAMMLTIGAADSVAAPITFSGTNTVSAWSVVVAGTTGTPTLGDFATAGFIAAVAVTGRPDYIADNDTGTHGSLGTFTAFTFKQEFNLAGLDPLTAVLQFQWAADDIGDGCCARGSWLPVFRLNGGALTNGGVPVGYSYGGTVTLNSGFVSGLNTLEFFVLGNGISDGMALAVVSATASPSTAPGASVPEPGTLLLFGTGALLIAHRVRRR